MALLALPLARASTESLTAVYARTFEKAAFGFAKMYLFCLFMRVLLSWFPGIDWNAQPWTFLRLVREGGREGQGGLALRCGLGVVFGVFAAPFAPFAPRPQSTNPPSPQPIQPIHNPKRNNNQPIHNTQITEPYLQIYRGILPPLFGQLDFTPLFGFLILQDVVEVMAPTYTMGLHVADTSTRWTTSDVMCYLDGF